MFYFSNSALNRDIEFENYCFLSFEIFPGLQLEGEGKGEGRKKEEDKLRRGRE